MAGMADPLKFIKAEDYFKAMRSCPWTGPTAVDAISPDAPAYIEPSASSNGISSNGTSDGAVSSNGISSNGPSDGTVSSNGISSNDTSDGAVSSNGISSNDTSDGAVSSNGISSNGISSNGTSNGTVSSNDTVSSNPSASAKASASPDGWVLLNENKPSHGITLTFNDKTRCVIQFIRPTVFRVRYDPAVKEQQEYGDENSRTILQDTTSELIKVLDSYRAVEWTAKIRSGPKDEYYELVSEVVNVKEVPDFNDKQRYKVGDGMKLIIYKNPFRIQAIRKLQPLPKLYPMPEEYSVPTGGNYKVVWETSRETFRWNIHEEHAMLKDVVLDVIKPGHGEYLGFGEQGGTSLTKRPTFMNYFNCDNMQYQQVYNQGPLDPREPLYHSDPFFLEVNGNPEHANTTSTFIDNLSQIAIDFGKTNSGYIKLGTRFNGLDVYVMSADKVPEIVRLQSDLVGRGMLKPRYVLGHHQGCYGYSTAEDLHRVVNKYREFKIPLDGMHLDVDFQDEFRTFTMNPDNNPVEMFRSLREKGIKCSTNITPVISTKPKLKTREDYKTLRDGLAQERFILDKRYTKGTTGQATDVRYVNYGGGTLYEINPNDRERRPDFRDPDNYEFKEAFNSKKPYRGAVYYGYNSGTPGHYVDLTTGKNRKWWGEQYKDLFEWGLEFVWQDMTTPAIDHAYGDMKGLPSRLLVNSDAIKKKYREQLAIEAWALYAYNLHKATYYGLGRLECRKNKRNFIIGRGSFATMYRFAGLWSGDNASTWDFWRITIPQVLSVGLNGVSITGSDTGGFEPGKNIDNQQEEDRCDPELLIRWYAGSFLLPWLRNHYVAKGRKKYQEPWQYEEPVPQIVKYYIELRYSLMQNLYDSMFENLINGLPIARSMLLTDTQDTSFFNETKGFLDTQYMCCRDILVAPIMHSKKENPGENREVYLPLGCSWYQSNLMPWDDQGKALDAPVEGGTVVDYVSKITSKYEDFQYIVPVFIREGALLPQIEVRQTVDDPKPNHIKFSIYPGKDRFYYLYLDDGVSRSSAPMGLPQNKEHQKQEHQKQEHQKQEQREQKGKKKVRSDPLDQKDAEAKSEFRKVVLEQETEESKRTIRIKREYDGYKPESKVGRAYTLVVYYLDGVDVKNIDVQVTTTEKDVDYEREPSGYKSETDLRAVIVRIKETIGTTQEVTITLTPKE